MIAAIYARKSPDRAEYLKAARRRPHGRGLRHERMSAGAGAEFLKQQRRQEWLSVKQPAPQNTKAPR